MSDQSATLHLQGQAALQPAEAESNLKPHETAIRGWASWLAISVTALLLIQAVTGLWVYLAPFSIGSQLQVLVHDSTDPGHGEAGAIRRTADDRAHRHHGTIATNFFMPQVLKLPHCETQVKLTEEWIRGETVIREIAHLWPSGPVASLHVTVPPQARPGEEISVRAVVTNRKAGHNLITGPSDFMRCWIHLRVLDAHGEVLAEWGSIDPATRESAFETWLPPWASPRATVLHNAIAGCARTPARVWPGPTTTATAISTCMWSTIVRGTTTTGCRTCWSPTSAVPTGCITMMATARFATWPPTLGWPRPSGRPACAGATMTAMATWTCTSAAMSTTTRADWPKANC